MSSKLFQCLDKVDRWRIKANAALKGCLTKDNYRELITEYCQRLYGQEVEWGPDDDGDEDPDDDDVEIEISVHDASTDSLGLLFPDGGDMDGHILDLLKTVFPRLVHDDRGGYDDVCRFRTESPVSYANRLAADALKEAERAEREDQSEEDRVTNPALYMRHIVCKNVGGAREKYCTKSNLQAIANLPAIAHLPRNKGIPAHGDSDSRWSAVAGELWRSVLTDDQKKELSDEFRAWKDSASRGGAGRHADVRHLGRMIAKTAIGQRACFPPWGSGLRCIDCAYQGPNVPPRFSVPSELSVSGP